jgi:hypothetical protein
MDTTPHVPSPAAAPAVGPVPAPLVVTPIRVSWGAILAGTVVSIGSWLLLHLVGMAVGLTAVDPDAAGGSLRAIGIGTGIWTVIAPLIALFLGGMVTARLTGLLDLPLSAIHGAVMWALTMVLGAFLVVQLIGSALGGATRLGGAAIGTTAQAAASAIGVADKDTLAAIGIDENDLVAQINERLRAQDKPTVTADQLKAALRDATSTAVRTGELDRQVLVESLASKTALSREDARDVAAQIEAQYRARRGQLETRARELGASAQETVLEAADTTGKVLGWTSLALALGLASALGGSLLGANRRRPLTHVPPHARVHAD